MNPTAERDYYTVAEAADKLNVSHSTVWRWIRAGKLSAHRVGSRSLRIKQGDLDRMVSQHHAGPSEGLSLEEARNLVGRRPSREELARRKELFERVQRNRKNRSIAPLTSDELVRLGRDRDSWYGTDE